MLSDFQDLFVSPIDKNKLQFKGTNANEKWLNGFLTKFERMLNIKL